ncbi:MAG: threonine--tRNA ligase, partial [Candidatus Lambdaproteobacteria bacterium]|nr:threonine--tRNA ligase [Candidatus Lambdaproteobacteria bacterium]
YVGRDNQRHRPYIIHRAPLGTHERFVAFLIEHYGGVFPTWLAPVQARLIPVTPAAIEHCHKLAAALRQELMRVEVDDSQETFSKKIRNGQVSKAPNLFIVGQKEMESERLTWKRHGERDQVTLPAAEALARLRAEIAGRVDWRRVKG